MIDRETPSMRTFVFHSLRCAASLLALPGLLMTSSARAEDTRPEGPLEVGLFGGAHFFSKNGELGVADYPGLVPGLENSGLLGVRLGHAPWPRLSLEGELVAIPTADTLAGASVFVLGWRAHALVHLLTTGKWRPFVLAGLGAQSAFTGRTGLAQVENDTDFALHWGAGLKYDVTPRLSLRGDFRHLLPPSNRGEGITQDFELHAGLSYRFGGASAPTAPASPAAPPPAPRDTDGDGLVDEQDTCPTQAEDKDGFQDEDGCPDPDNDGDGVPDAADKCVNQAETRNGFQDEDGCADELPQVMQRFTGVMTGLQFKVGSETLQASSHELLDEAVRVLEQFPDVRLEISGHTSAEGDAQQNQELSRRRAEAVKQYLLTKGIAASRLTAQGFGSSRPVAPNDTEAGREKNRRIEFRVINDLPPATAPVPGR